MLEKPVESFLERLVGFDTTSHKSNLELVAWLEAELAGMGVKSHRVPAPDGNKACLFATIGPAQQGGIGLSGHTDVVPVKGQDWRMPPFRLTQREGRLYGRGTSDMKGFLACMLAAVPLFVRRRLKIPIHLLFSYDEEVGCTGVRPMIAALGQALPKPQMVIVGEPTGMAVVDAHKGIWSFATEVRGLEAHSSTPHRGVNAIFAASRLVQRLEELGESLEKGVQDSRFDPPWTTLHVGLISGGTAPNIIPRHCRFVWEMRLVPGQDGNGIVAPFARFAQKLEAQMHRLSQTTGITVTQTNDVPTFGGAGDRAAIRLAQHLLQSNESFAVSYGTEAGLFEQAGCASVVCGPGHIAQAHKPDEYIERAELEKCMAFMARLADHVTA